MKRFDENGWDCVYSWKRPRSSIEKISEWVKRRNEKEQREYYEREANRSALLWLGLVLLLSLWLYAEIKHAERMERKQDTEQVQ